MLLRLLLKDIRPDELFLEVASAQSERTEAAISSGGSAGPARRYPPPRWLAGSPKNLFRNASIRSNV